MHTALVNQAGAANQIPQRLETLLVWVSSATQGSQTPPDRGEKERERERRGVLVGQMAVSEAEWGV